MVRKTIWITDFISTLRLLLENGLNVYYIVAVLLIKQCSLSAFTRCSKMAKLSNFGLQFNSYVDIEMKYRLSFAEVTIHPDNILEMLVNDGIEITLEMIEELDRIIADYCPSNFILLINSINNYTYTYEAQLCFGLNENIIGIAFLYYSQSDLDFINRLTVKRKVDNLNSNKFSGLEFGRQQAYTWSKNELSYLGLNVS